jgi:hypothetical protein
MVEYPRSPAEVLDWSQAQDDKWYEVPTGAEVFRSNPIVRGVCTGEIVPEATYSVPFSEQFRITTMRSASTEFNRARVLLNEPLYVNELYAFQLKVRNPTFLDNYLMPMMKEAQIAQDLVSEQRVNGWDLRLDERVIYRGSVAIGSEPNSVVQWTRDALGYVDGSRDPTVIFNVKRVSSGLMSEVPWERSWQMYKFNWHKSLMNVEFRDPVSEKLAFGPDVAFDYRITGAM